MNVEAVDADVDAVDADVEAVGADVEADDAVEAVATVDDPFVVTTHDKSTIISLIR